MKKKGKENEAWKMKGKKWKVKQQTRIIKAEKTEKKTTGNKQRNK